MTEVWKVIPSYPNYEASNLGNIRRKETQRIKKQYICNHGYCRTCLTVNNKSKNLQVHRLVLEAFTGPPTAPFALHNNGKRQDNRSENLRWGTAQENADDALKHGTRAKGDKIKNSILNPEKVLAIRLLNKHGYSPEKIGLVMEIPPSTIRNVVNGFSWAWVKDEDSSGRLSSKAEWKNCADESPPENQTDILVRGLVKGKISRAAMVYFEPYENRGWLCSRTHKPVKYPLIYWMAIPELSAAPQPPIAGGE